MFEGVNKDLKIIKKYNYKIYSIYVETLIKDVFK